MKKLLHVYITVIAINLLSTGYVKAMYLWSAEVKSGQVTCEGAGFGFGESVCEISPDKKRIIVKGSIGELVVKEIDGTIVRLLDGNYESVSWSNDSKSLTARVGKNIVIISADEDTEEFVLTKLTDVAFLPDTRWSPDGRWIALGYTDKSESLRIDLIRPDGTEKHPLISMGFGVIEELAWSPDSKLLAATLFVDKIKVIDIDSASIIFAADNIEKPQWSPKKRQIAYIQSRPPALLVTDIDGNETVEVTSLAGSYGADVRWSPDGAYIALMDEGVSSEEDIWIVDVNRKVKRKLTSGEIEHLLDWSLDGEKIYYLSYKAPFQLPSKKDVIGLIDTAILLYESDRYEEAAELVATALASREIPPVRKTYAWDGDFPGLMAQMKRLYRDKGNGDFFGAGIRAMVLLDKALRQKVALGERVGYLQGEPLTLVPSSQEEEKRKFALILDEAKRYYAEGKYDDALLKLAEAYQLLQGKSTLVPKTK